MSEKSWKTVSWDECHHCGSDVEVFTQLEGDKAYDGDEARCVECHCPGSVLVDESQGDDGDDGVAYVQWHDEPACDCWWCKNQNRIDELDAACKALAAEVATWREWKIEKMVGPVDVRRKTDANPTAASYLAAAREETGR